MGFAAPMMMLAGTGMQALSAYRQGQYASMQAKAQARMSDYNAMVAETNAEAIRQKSIFDQIRAVKLGERRLGTIRVGQTEENIWRVAAEQGAETALGVSLIGHRGLVEAGRQKTTAGMYRTEAANYRTTAKNLETAGKFNAANYLLQGFGTMSLKEAWPDPLDFLNIKTTT